MNAKSMYDKLAAAGIRIFAIKLCGGTPHNDYMLFVHADKTPGAFRDDIRFFKKKIFQSKEEDNSDRAFNKLMKYLHNLGYAEVLDVVSDVFEGRIASECSRIVDDPNHENQEDGFGHFGWGKEG